MGGLVICICLLLLAVIAIAIYVILISSVFPKKILKASCSENESKDRGVKKYVFPEGRGVVYMPRLAVRKYVESYVLFTHEGYKYLKCRLSMNLSELKYSVVMFNNKNEILDVINVDEHLRGGLETEAVALHHDTSYVSLVVKSADENVLNDESLFVCKLKRLGVYGGAVSLVSFLVFALLFAAISVIDKLLLDQTLLAGVNLLIFILPALAIGALASWIIYNRTRRAKTLRWTK